MAHIYHIRVRGHLSPEWSEWLDGLAIERRPDGDTLLYGPLEDQAALHGLLAKIRNLGLPLLSVNSDEPGARDGKQSDGI